MAGLKDPIKVKHATEITDELRKLLDRLEAYSPVPSWAPASASSTVAAFAWQNDEISHFGDSYLDRCVLSHAKAEALSLADVQAWGDLTLAQLTPELIDALSRIAYRGTITGTCGLSFQARLSTRSSRP